MTLNRKNIIFFIIFLFFINGIAVDRFKTVSFFLKNNISISNISSVFAYKEKYKTPLKNTHFIGYNTADIFSQNNYFDRKFIFDLFESDFFLLNSFDDFSISYIATNYKAKFERIKRFMDHYYYKMNDMGGIYFLFVTDSLPDDSRYYIKTDPVDALKNFYIKNIKNFSQNDAIVLFTDVDYYKFRKICDEVEFVDIIFNFQDFESGKIYNKSIYNISLKTNILNRADFMFGRNGFLSLAFYDVDLEKEEDSKFINRILKSRTVMNND